MTTQDPGFQQVLRCFHTHQPRPEVQQMMDTLLVRIRDLAFFVVEAVPPCRERSMALTELEAAATHARAGLVREDAVNLSADGRYRSKDGHPRHPLMLSYETPREPWL